MSQARGFRARAASAIREGRTSERIAAATDQLAVRRKAAETRLGNYPELRLSGREARSRAISKLPELLEQLAQRIESNGGRVFFAADADEARRHITELIVETGGQHVAKAKSMVTEEIRLNAALEDAGLTVTETDLGEWLVHLAGEPPSHVVTPSIHMNRADVAELLRIHGRTETSDQPEDLNAYAREQLRDVFLRADVGITGCNFAIAETGSICIVTNEGNGRMVTTLPKMHIAVMGMERIVETWDDLDVLLTLLPRAATGADSTVYVNVSTGPRKKFEADGPDEFHLVVVDNGRSEMLGSELHEALYCIRCASCLNVCPVFRQIGGHAYGTTYAGPIGSVISPLLEGPDALELAKASTLCGACYDACPVMIPLQDLLLTLRRRDAPNHRVESLAWKTWARAWRRPWLYRISTAMVSTLARVIPRRLVPSAWSKTRSVPRPDRAERSHRRPRAGER